MEGFESTDGIETNIAVFGVVLQDYVKDYQC